MDALILDTSFNAVGLIDVFDTFIWTERYSAYGDFEIFPRITDKNLSDLKEDYYIVINDSDRAMIIEDIQIESDSEDGPTLGVAGRSLESILERRIVWNQTILSGNLQDAIKKILDENVIFPDDPDNERRIDNFVFEKNEDEAVTSLELASEAQFTGDTVYDVIKVLCDVFQIGFKVTLSTENKFVFKLYAGADRSYEQSVNPYVIFSPNFENLINSSYLRSKRSLKTVTLVAGEGEGSERKTVTVSSTDGAGTGLNRRELYTDARDVSSNVDGTTLSDEEYNEQLTQRGNEKLAECVEVKSFEGQSDTNATFRLGEDYFIGDIVQIENEYGMESRSRVTEVIRSESGSGFEMYPTFTKVE